MKRFKFKLENVLKYRITLENLAKNSYSEALRVLNTEKDRLNHLENSKKRLMLAYNIKAGSIATPETLEFISRFASQLVHLIEQQKKVIAEKERVANKKFQEWNKKRKDVRIIEQLKEKKWKEYLRDIEKEEQKFQDEIFIAKRVREMLEHKNSGEIEVIQ